MHFNFEHLTPGYCGVYKKQLSLNSGFYSELFSNQVLLKTSIIFPQRIINSDFMHELSGGETDDAKIKLRNHLNLISQKVKNGDHTNEQEIVNWYNIALRHAQWNVITDALPIKLHNTDLALELEYIKVVAQSQSSLLLNKDIDPVAWTKLFLFLENNNQPASLTVILISTALIVMACRFGCKIKNEILVKAQKKILTTMQNVKKISYAEFIRFSFAYRGMAMLPFLDKNTIFEYLENAKLFATEAIMASSAIQKIVAKENLFTCSQTLSKWNMQNSNVSEALKSLEMMIELDPFDAVGYAETAFLYLKLHDYKNAEHYFEKAAMLGPPSIGMHLFYRGLSMEKLDRFTDAENCFNNAIKADETGISPYLGMLDLYTKMNNIEKRKTTATKILNEEILFSQLDENEKKQIAIFARS